MPLAKVVSVPDRPIIRCEDRVLVRMNKRSPFLVLDEHEGLSSGILTYETLCSPLSTKRFDAREAI